MAEETRTVTLQAKAEGVTADIRKVRKEIRELKREQRESGKLTDEQKKRLGDLKDTLADLRDEGALYRAELKKQKKAQKEAAKAAQEQAKASQELGQKLANVGKAAAVAAVAFGKAIKVFADADAVQGNLSRSIERTGKSASETAETLNALNKSFTENLNNLGLSIDSQAEAFRVLISESKNAETAQRDLTRAIDLAADRNIELAEATEQVRKIRAGEVEEIKNFTSLTKDQAAELAKITNESERVAAAFAVLDKETKGAAQSTRGMSNDVAAAEENLKLAVVAAGDLASQLAVGTSSLTNALLEMAGILPKNTGLLQAFSGGLQELADNARSISEQGGLVALLFPDVQSRLDDIRAIRAENEKLARQLQGFRTGVQIVPDVASDEAMRIEERQRAARRAIREREEAERRRAAEQRRRERERQQEQERRRTERAQQVTGLPVGDFGVGEEDLRRLEAEARAEEQAEQARQRQEEELARANEAFEQEKLRNEERERELDLRERIAQLQLEGNELEAEKLRIQQSDLTQSEKLLALRGAEAKQEQKVAAQRKTVADQELKASAEQQKAIEAGISGASAAASAFFDEEADKAVVRAAVESAESIAAFAFGNIPGGIAHAAAAASFLVASQKAGKGGGAVASAAGGGGANVVTGGAGSAVGADTEAGSIVSGGGRFGAAAQAPVVVNVAFRSFGPPTQEDQRMIANSVADEMKNRI